MKFPAFYGTPIFIAAFTSVRQLSLSMSQLDPVQAPTSHFLNMHLNIILPSTSGSPNWSLSIRFPHQNPVYVSHLLHMHYMTRPSNSSRFDLPNNIGWGVLNIFWQGQEIYFFSKTSDRLRSPSLLFNGEWDVFTPSIERSWHQVNHSLPSYTEVTNERCCTSTPSPVSYWCEREQLDLYISRLLTASCVGTWRTCSTGKTRRIEKNSATDHGVRWLDNGKGTHYSKDNTFSLTRADMCIEQYGGHFEQ